MPKFGKLGRIPADPVRLNRMIKMRFTGVLPEYPVTADHLSKVDIWILGQNDKHGTCGPTSVANFVKMVWKYLLNEDVDVTDAAVIDLYKRSGNPNFPYDDNGVDMTVMLDALFKDGIDVTHKDGTVTNEKPVCYARIDVDPATQRAATAIFGGVLWGVDLQTAQQTQNVWDYKRSPLWGGHAILGGSYTSKTGAGQVDESIVSWQEVFGTTYAFVTHQLAEAYIPVFQPLVDHPDFLAGVDLPALAAAYEAVTGRKFPIPVDPPQPPTPEPPPPPAPEPTPDNGGCNLLAAALNAAAKAFSSVMDKGS